MSPRIPDQRPPAPTYIDYRPAKCRCGVEVQPHEYKCHACGRKQNLLFEGLDRLYEDDLEGLAATLERMAAKSPKDTLLLNQLAGAYVLKGDYEKARNTYGRVLELDPDMTDAQLNLGVILACLGQNEAAVKQLSEFVRLDVHSPKVERALRAISSIRGVPYEDVLTETGMAKTVRKPSGRERVAAAREARTRERSPRPVPEVGSLSARMRRGTVYMPPSKGIVIPRRQWGPIDVFLWLLVIICAAALYLYPEASRSIVDAALIGLEDQYVFTVAEGDLPGTPIFEELEDETGEEEEDPGPIVNANPETDSYFPLALNNRWNYVSYDTRDQEGGGTRENVSSGVLRVSNLANTSLGVWRLFRGSEVMYYRETPTGLFSVRNPLTPWSGSLMQIPYPPEPGTTNRDGQQLLEVEGNEYIQTELGTFACVRLHFILGDIEDPIAEWYAWYGQGVGLVKYMGVDSDGTFHFRELQNYQLH